MHLFCTLRALGIVFAGDTHIMMHQVGVRLDPWNRHMITGCNIIVVITGLLNVHYGSLVVL